MEKTTLYTLVDNLVDVLGTNKLLEEIVRGMSSDELESSLKYICRMYDIKYDNKGEIVIE